MCVWREGPFPSMVHTLLSLRIVFYFVAMGRSLLIMGSNGRETGAPILVSLDSLLQYIYIYSFGMIIWETWTVPWKYDQSTTTPKARPISISKSFQEKKKWVQSLIQLGHISICHPNLYIFYTVDLKQAFFSSLSWTQYILVSSYSYHH